MTTSAAFVPTSTASGAERETLPGAIDAEVERHDAAVAALGLDVWLGNEPTFTDRRSQNPEWLTAAVGDDKHERARRLIALLWRGRPGAAVLRTLGRHYPGEEQPRWSLGLYGSRDGTAVWTGVPDPLAAGDDIARPDLDALRWQLVHALRADGATVFTYDGERDLRVLWCSDPARVLPDPAVDRRLFRPTMHGLPVPPDGFQDELASEGISLLVIDETLERGLFVARVELPACGTVAAFRALLAVVAAASCAAGTPALVLAGFPPPVDETVAWTTLTPDPAVVEVNMAPHSRLADFLADNRHVFRAADACGLTPYRLYWNGTVADSGGAGQITLGGPTPARSPFFLAPHLLPRLLRYLNRHPSLSYLFSHDHVGGSGQSVRPDERGEEALAELRLALALLDRQQPAPATLWRALAPFLTDSCGNAHRAEVNVEKLWNPDQPGRGQLGLVEFRALRMQHTPERAAAVAALLRAVVAMLAVHDRSGPLCDWGVTLHDRFALPFCLEVDLRAVLRELSAAGLGLGPALVGELLHDGRLLCAFRFEGVELRVRRAFEFWPLVGDSTSQHGTSRLMDASTARYELLLREAPGSHDADLGAWHLRAEDVDLPLRTEMDDAEPVRVLGVRTRSFVAAHGLHPTLPALDPVQLTLVHPEHADALVVRLHDWHPAGLAYDDVPADLEAARDRRERRCVAARVPRAELPPARPAPPGALRPWCVDLRWLST